MTRAVEGKTAGQRERERVRKGESVCLGVCSDTLR